MSDNLKSTAPSKPRLEVIPECKRYEIRDDRIEIVRELKLIKLVPKVDQTEQ